MLSLGVAAVAASATDPTAIVRLSFGDKAVSERELAAACRTTDSFAAIPDRLSVVDAGVTTVLTVLALTAVVWLPTKNKRLII